MIFCMRRKYTICNWILFGLCFGQGESCIDMCAFFKVPTKKGFEEHESRTCKPSAVIQPAHTATLPPTGARALR